MDNRVETLKKSLELSEELNYNIQDLEELFDAFQLETLNNARKALKNLDLLLNNVLKGEELALKNKWYNGIVNNRKG